MTEQEEFEFRARLEAESATAPVPQEPVAPKSLGQTAIDSFKGLNPLRQVVGLGETALQMGSGAISQAFGGVRGLVELATGGSVDDATRLIKEYEEAGTYRPRLAHGKLASKLVAAPMEVASEGAGWAGEQIGGDAGRAIGEVVPAMAATVAGGVPAFRAGSKMGPSGPALRRTLESTKRAVSGEPPIPTAAQISESRLNAPQIEAANVARKHGIAIDPGVANPTIKNRVMSGLTGEGTLSEALAAANKGKWEAPLKQELGIASDRPISMETIREVRQRASAPSETISQLGQLTPDATTVSSLEALKTDPLIGGSAAYRKQSRLVDEAMTSLEQGMPANLVLDNISQLRKEARAIYNMEDAGRAKLATAETNIGIANALEGMIESNLERMGHVDLLSQYRKGRADLAKSYVLENVTDLTTGKIDPSKLAKMASKDNAMTGAFADIGKVASNFPESLGKKSGGLAPYAERRLARSLAPGVLGEAFSIATVLPRLAAAKKLASSKYQAKNAAPMDFRPMRERMGYGDPIPEPAPWTLAPEGEALPTTRQNIEPTVRPTLELAPLEADVAALRNKGAKVPMDEGMVEFTPGARMDYPLRQELLDSPKSATLGYLRDKIAELEKTKDKSLGFWKQRYAKELEEMQPILEAEKLKYGITDAASEHGLRRKLYEGGGSTVYPIIKTLRRQ